MHTPTASEHCHPGASRPHHACLCADCKTWRQTVFGHDAPVDLVRFCEAHGKDPASRFAGRFAPALAPSGAA